MHTHPPNTPEPDDPPLTEAEAMRRDHSRAALAVLAQTRVRGGESVPPTHTGADSVRGADSPPAIPTIPSEIIDQLVALADFVSLTRSEVSRDKHGLVQYIPLPEVGTRVAKALPERARAKFLGTNVLDVYGLEG